MVDFLIFKQEIFFTLEIISSVKKFCYSTEICLMVFMYLCFFNILKGTNLGELLESITTLAELHDLKAKRECPVDGVVLESRSDKGKGYIFQFK